MSEIKIMLDGLNCAHCASKIETAVQKQVFVQNATLNFVGKYINIEYTEKNRNEILDVVKNIVKKLEPDVDVFLSNENLDEICEVQQIYNSEQCDYKCSHSHNHKHTNEHEHKHTHENTHEHEHNESNIDKTTIIRIVLSTILFLPAVIFENNEILCMTFSILSYAIIGYDIIIKAVKNIMYGQIFDENFLMVVASLGALIIGEYPEAAGVMLFYQIGELIQDMAVNKSRKQIKSLLNIKPEFANLKSNEGIKKVKPEIVKIGDIIVVKPGEKIPLDGIIIAGNSSIDTSCLTGESMPVDKGINEEVLSGSINQTGVLTIKVTKSFKESTVSKILYLVEKASNKKSETENFITKFAKYYTPIVILIAAIIAIVPSIIFKDTVWIYKGLTFLVVSCPCALVLSIPLTYFSGLGSASKYGILIKGGNYLEALSNAEIAVFDKTGTLTEGKFTVSEIKAVNGFKEDELLKIAAYGEYYSNHPIANSIKSKFGEKINESYVKNYTELAGYGIKATVNDKVTLLGNDKLMIKENINFEKAIDKPGTILYVVYDNKFAGFIVISDIVKKDADSLASKLRNVGIRKTVMLTGDNKITAEYVKNKVGVDEAYSNLLPNDKVDKVEKLIADKSKKGKLLFVGDGINDAPVLMRADIGFAMGGIGSDAAIESADVVLMNDEPSKVYQSVKIAKKTKTIASQNIIFCLAIKFLIMILTIYSNVSMPFAVFADVGVAIIAILNASRILAIKF